MTILIVEDDPSVRHLLFLQLIAYVAPGARDIPNIGNFIGEIDFASLKGPGKGTVILVDNLDDAVSYLGSGIGDWGLGAEHDSSPNPKSLNPNPSTADAVLCDGTFPAFPADKIPFDSEHNRPRIMWPQVLGYANKRGIPFVLLTDDSNEVEYAKRKGVAAFAKPEGTGAAIQCLLQGLGIGDQGSGGEMNPQPLNPNPSALDDERFTNGRLRGCISPNDEEQGLGIRDPRPVPERNERGGQGLAEEVSSTPNPQSPNPNSCSLPDATGEPYGLKIED